MCRPVDMCFTLIQVDVRGVLVTLLDTAGIRETDDEVEAVGVQRSQSAASASDIVLFIYDAEVCLFSCYNCDACQHPAVSPLVCIWLAVILLSSPD
jgi:tRNA U34 5-carboxymethylaminomethyl modifying GTPase MnmE/TrmE